jgi:hypothetical protein
MFCASLLSYVMSSKNSFFNIFCFFKIATRKWFLKTVREVNAQGCYGRGGAGFRQLGQR